ncbi:MAG: hypothetical protein KF819_01935 [Labilithrix sp.]|nr:hypothetical protein [Labilithrix sp.]
MKSLLGSVAAAAFFMLPAAARAESFEGETVDVHLEGDADAQLEVRTPDGWVPVCAAPCDRAVRLDARYRIGGSGVRPSSAFSLHASDGARVVLHADTASSTGFTGGIVMLSAGTLAAAFGGLVLLSAASGLGSRHDRESAPLTGGLLLGGGLATAGGGLWLTLANASTSVTQGPRRIDERPAPARGMEPPAGMSLQVPLLHYTF